MIKADLESFASRAEENVLCNNVDQRVLDASSQEVPHWQIHSEDPRSRSGRRRHLNARLYLRDAHTGGGPI